MESVGAFGQCPQMGVGGFGSGVGQSVVEGVADQVAVAADGAGQRDELGYAGVRGPRQPPGQQLPPMGSLDN